MRARLDVLCVADMCVDLVLTGNVRPRFQQVEQIIADYRLELGGSANIFATQFAKLGGAAGVIGRVGNDAFGEHVLQSLKGAGVDVRCVSRDDALKTGLGVALAEPADRAILTYLGTIDAVAPEDLDCGMLAGCRHWHIASYFLLSKLREHWPGWLSRCREGGVTTSLDTNWDPEERWESVAGLLPLVDVFLPNEAEALAISGEVSVERAGGALAERGPLVLVKRGSRGAVVFDKSRCWTAPAIAAGRVVDAIGAGDNFDAGFLRAWQLGWDIPACLELGQRCAVSSLTAAGGIEGQLMENV